MHGCIVSIYVCCYNMNISPHGLSREDNILWDKMSYKCTLSMLRAHFYVITFIKNELQVSIISTTFNDFGCMQ